MQNGVGEDEIGRPAAPIGNVALGKRQPRQARSRRGEHVRRGVEADDLAFGIAFGEQLRRIARSATEIDDPTARAGRDAREKIRSGTAAFGFEASVRAGVPILRHGAHKLLEMGRRSILALATKLQHFCDWAR